MVLVMEPGGGEEVEWPRRVLSIQLAHCKVQAHEQPPPGPPTTPCHPYLGPGRLLPPLLLCLYTMYYVLCLACIKPPAYLGTLLVFVSYFYLACSLPYTTPPSFSLSLSLFSFHLSTTTLSSFFFFPSSIFSSIPSFETALGVIHSFLSIFPSPTSPASFRRQQQ